MNIHEEIKAQMRYMSDKLSQHGIKSITDKDTFILSNLLYKRDYLSEPTLEGLTIQRGIDWGLKLFRQILEESNGLISDSK